MAVTTGERCIRALKRHIGHVPLVQLPRKGLLIRVRQIQYTDGSFPVTFYSAQLTFELIKPPLTFLSAAVLLFQRTDRIRWMNCQNLMGGWTCVTMFMVRSCYEVSCLDCSAPFTLSAASKGKAMSTYVWDVSQNIVEMFCPLPLQPRATDALPRGP